MHMHFFYVNHSNALHLRFLVHNNNLFHICSYSFCICLFAMQTIMNTSNNINYILLLTKSEVELPERALKKPKIKKTFYPSEAQKQLLNICNFINFSNQPGFASLVEVNEFVIKFVNKRTEFEKNHKSLPYPGVCQILSSF